MESLLNFDKPLDVGLLDHVVQTFYEGRPGSAEHEAAKQLLAKFKEHPASWSSVDSILENSQSQATKFFGLQCLEDAVRYRWRLFPREQCEAIKNYVVGIIIRLSSTYEVMQESRLFLNKLNVLLVNILKQEWLGNWKSFIPEIVASSQANESLCENNLVILRLLSEDVFDFSSGTMTMQKREELRNTFNREFSLIYNLCEFVMESSQRPSLLLAMLQTLQVFLNWIPLEYVFQTNMIAQLVAKFLPVPQFQAAAVGCLVEIAGIESAAHSHQFAQLYIHVVGQLCTIYPIKPTFPQLVASVSAGTASELYAELVMSLANFFGTFFRKHFALIDDPAYAQPVVAGLFYLVELSACKDVEVWKVCLEFWSIFAAQLYNESSTSISHPSSSTSTLATSQKSSQPQSQPPLLLLSPIGGGGGGGGGGIPRDLFRTVLSRVRSIIVSRMPRPVEVLIVEDENGEIVHEPLKDTDTITLYKSMRDTLICLTHLDSADTQDIMRKKLDLIMGNHEWSYYAINTLCWAIGAISGAMLENEERAFIIHVIRDLLQLVDMKTGKDNKAVVASNIMFVVGQYPRFMRAHWRFLKTVVQKLFEFMHETHPGVQDMACDTFLKIAQTCKTKFVVPHDTQPEPFVEEIIEKLPSHTSRLEPRLRETFYEAVGYMVHEHPDWETRRALVAQLFASINSRWQQILDRVASDPALLNQLDVLRSLLEFLRINRKAAHSLGENYIYQLSTVFVGLLNVYKYYSQEVSSQFQRGGMAALNMANVRLMRSVKKEILLLMETFVEQCENLDLLSQPIPILLDLVLPDFRNGVSETRDPEVWSLARAIVARFGQSMTDNVPVILAAILEPTLEIIVQNFVDHRLMRVNMFEFLRTVTSVTFASYFRLPQEQLKLVIDSIIWAMKHPDRDISITGLMILSDFLMHLAQTGDEAAQMIYKAYFLAFIDDVFYILTNGLHKFGFQYQVQVLRQLILAVVSGSLGVPLWDSPASSNSALLQKHLFQRISTAFPNVSRESVQQTVLAMFSGVMDPKAFKVCLRDFLVSIKEFSATGEDNQVLLNEPENK